jgi:hypothetical protein
MQHSIMQVDLNSSESRHIIVHNLSLFLCFCPPAPLSFVVKSHFLNHLPKELANFGYRSERKVEIFKES